MHKLSAYVIVHRTQSNQTPNANQSDSGRNTIRQRTESPGGAAVSAAPTKQTGNLLQLSQLGFAACQSKNCTNQATKPTLLM